MNYKQPRIYRVTYKATRHPGHRRQVATILMKVPYGGAFAMTEVLTRMITVGELERFTIEAAMTHEIEAWGRDNLKRWLPALTDSSWNTGVDWTK